MSRHGSGMFPFGHIYHGRGNILSAKFVSLRGELTGLFASWALRKEFRNDTGASIDAGYLFTYLRKTALLGMNMQIGSHSFKGQVIERKDFRGYMGESSIDSIIRFDEAAYGVYGANLGEIGVNESIIVNIHYANFLEYEKGQICLYIPAWNIGESPYFDLSITLYGEIAKGNIHSPTHSLCVEEDKGHKTVTLNCTQLLERDFALYIKDVCSHSHVLRTTSNTGQLITASFAPMAHKRKNQPVFLKLLVDCSVSMQGIGIDMAKRVLREILRFLHPEDRVSYSRFGSDVEHLWHTPRPCDSFHMQQLASAIDATYANMERTNLEKALLSICSSITRTEDVDLAPTLILISDGQVENPEEVIQAAKTSQHRIYVIGVGEFPDIELMQGIAEKTGGICEIIASKKDIPGAISRMFRQISRSIAAEAEIIWPDLPDWEANIPQYLFSGETLHCFAGFNGFMPQCHTSPDIVKLRYKIDDKERKIKTGIPEMLENNDLIRFAYSRLLEECASGMERLVLGLRYQLLTDQTALILREDTDDKFPQYEDDFHMICNARAWNDGLFLGDEERRRKNVISHSGWIERQKSAAQRLKSK